MKMGGVPSKCIVISGLKFFSSPNSLSGCGTGNYTSTLSKYVGQVTGVEHNSGMLEQARKKTASLSNVKLVQGDAAKIPLTDGYCDAVICTQVSHLHDIPVCGVEIEPLAQAPKLQINKT